MFPKLRYLLPYTRQHRGKLVAIILMTLAATATSVLQPWPMKILVDYAIGDVACPAWLQTCTSLFGHTHSSFLLILVAGLLSLLLFALGAALDVGLSWAWMATGQRMVYELAANVFSHLQRLSLGYHSRSSVGDKLDRLTTDTWCIYSIVNDVLVTPVQCLCTIVGVGIVAWLLDPWLTLLSLAISPVLALSVRFFGPRLKRRAKTSREAHARLTSFVHQTVTSIPLVQAYNAESRNRAEFQSLVDDAVSASQQRVLVDKSFAFVNGLANTTGVAIVIFAGGQQVVAGVLSIGGLLVFLAYVRTLQGSFRQLLEVYSKLKNSEASLDRVMEILEEVDRIDEFPQATSIPSTGTSAGASVTFKDVSFGYEPGRPVLHDITFSIAPGERVALVGPTGAGKSTLAAMIPRFFDPWTGTVSVNGLDVRLAKLDSLRSMIATVAQEPFLLPLSVTETIAYGCRTATQASVIRAAKAAQAHDFIEQLPQGYATILGQRGATLSGGQKQRLAIARALVLEAPLVILDEPTSALDAKTEADMMRAIERLMINRTTLIIAHRLSTIQGSDRILVLDSGRIVESGTHDELLANNGVYAEFIAAQTFPPAEALA